MKVIAKLIMGAMPLSRCSCRNSVVSQTNIDTASITNRNHPESVETPLENPTEHPRLKLVLWRTASGHQRDRLHPVPDVTTIHDISDDLSANTSIPFNEQILRLTYVEEKKLTLKEVKYCHWEEYCHWVIIVEAQCRIHCGLKVFNKMEPSLFDIIASYLIIPYPMLSLYQ